MNQRLKAAKSIAAKTLEFSAHAVHRRGILPVPDQLSTDCIDWIIRAVLETQLDHLRTLGYTNVADLFDPFKAARDNQTQEVILCPDSPPSIKSEPSSTPPQPSIANSQPTRPPA